MNSLALICGMVVLAVTGALEFAPTRVFAPAIVKTVTPADGSSSSKGYGVKYVETVYKAADHKTLIHTIEPLRPSYEVSYLSTSSITINNQTIATSSVEFSTRQNMTVLYDSDATQLYTYNGAPTYYQTLEYSTQRIEYTPVSGSNTVNATTIMETNALPIF